MADDDMPPPLEDMSATLEQARKMKELRLGAATQNIKNTQPKIASVPQHPKQASTQKEQQQSSSHPQPTKCTKSSEKENVTASSASKKTGSGDFGGMKRGFLFGGSKSNSGSSSQKTKTAAQNSKTNSVKKDDAIPFIKPKTQDKDSALRMDEVQAAMESSKGFLLEKDWVTDDLLEKVQKNETLGKRLGDPQFMQAVTEFQVNPKAAMTKYADNREMQLFLKEFCGILGEHFQALGDKEGEPGSNQKPATATHNIGPKITEITDDNSSFTATQPSVPMDPHVQQILSDPINQQILIDPQIQQLIENLKSEPEKAQRMLRDGDTDFRLKVDRLISLGLLKFQA